jgi:hypothetical protein
VRTPAGLDPEDVVTRERSKSVTGSRQTAGTAARPILFVAREPDETLRTFLPVLAEIRRRGFPCLVLFHHVPTPWALERLAELDVPVRQVVLPKRLSPRGPGMAKALSSTAAELRQLWSARRLARRLIAEVDPVAVVVIQDTLLLERFLVRAANRLGRGTVVIQWAFTFPQSMYDLLNEIQKSGGRRPTNAGSNPRVPASPRPRVPNAARRPSLYALAQQLLDVKFDLVQSYGGGEARIFAVMGEAFRQQFLAQGVRKERIEVTGHPLHDAAFAQRAAASPERAAEIKARHGLPPDSRVILYATQPVLWRAVVTPDELVQNVRALGRAVAALGPDFLLVLKLHPRERLDDYAAALDGDLPLRLIKDAEVAELIAVADVFISSSSSTVLLAMMLDKPIVTVNFNQVPHFDYYETVGGTLHTKSPNAAADALQLTIFDEPTQTRLAAERATVLSHYARFDGQATTRLAELILAESGLQRSASIVPGL